MTHALKLEGQDAYITEQLALLGAMVLAAFVSRQARDTKGEQQMTEESSKVMHELLTQFKISEITRVAKAFAAFNGIEREETS